AQRVVEIEQAAYGPSEVHVAVAIYNLAEIYFAKGNSDEAEKFFGRVVGIYENSSERESMLAGTAFERLGTLQYKRHDNKNAIRLFERSLKIVETQLGKDDLKVAD